MKPTEPRSNSKGAPQETPDVSDIKNPDVAHEHSDVSIRGIVLFGGGLLVAAIIIHIGIWFLLEFFKTGEQRSQPPPPPLARSDRLPPEPRLQGAPGHEIHPMEEMRQLRAKEDEALGSYGWVDKQAGIARIPIAQAMDILAQRGLPARPQDAMQRQGDAAQPATDQPLPADSSSGRMLERRP